LLVELKTSQHAARSEVGHPCMTASRHNVASHACKAAR
jgi:hypothetical protein